MAVLPLSIKDTYVPTWGTWECVREIIQNGIDEDQKGNKLTVEHQNGWLTVYNHSAHMETNVLLMGETDKSNNPKLIGEHGEGLDVGLLAGIRSGLEIKITTQTHSWHPYIGFAKLYKSNVLCIRTRKLKKRLDGTTVSIKIDKETWSSFTKRFIRFANIDPEKTIQLKDTGMVILDPQYKGDVFVKGIFVQHVKDLNLGYDLVNISVDRDRRVINAWDLKYKLADVYKKAVSSQPNTISPIIYHSLRDGKPDTDGLEYAYAPDLANAVAEEFIKEQGHNAIPVTSIGESSNLDHINQRGVVVPKLLKEVLSSSPKIKTSYQIQEEYRKSVSTRYSWHDLTETEQSNLQETASLLDAVIPSLVEEDYVSILEKTEVVDFLKSDLLGGQFEDNKIFLAKRVLSDKKETLRVLLHEEAHRISKSGDGTADHIDVLEDIWSALYWNR